MTRNQTNSAYRIGNHHFIMDDFGNLVWASDAVHALVFLEFLTYVGKTYH